VVEIAGIWNRIMKNARGGIMSRIVILGAGGAVGSVASRVIGAEDSFSEVVLVDINLERAKAVADEIKGKMVLVKKIDILDERKLKETLKGSSVVLNCSGPFYKFAKPVMKSVLSAKVNYVDINDDVDVTIEVMKMDSAVKEKGLKALIGMGSSPGVTNIIAKMVSTSLLDETDSIDIFHAHGGEPIEGEAVIAHRFHCMSIDIPMFLDGRLQYVKYFEPDGIALREKFKFPLLGEVLLYPYPHPEQVTIPRYIKCKRVTNKGTVLPEQYYNLIRDMCQLGLASKEPVNVKGKKVVPYDFAMAYILRERERILKETRFGSQRGCVSVIVKGKKDGKYQEYRAHLASASQALGEGTGIPAAMGAILMQEGKVSGSGVMPPEACLNPFDFLALVPKVMKLDKKKKGGKSFSGVMLEQVDENGNIKELNL